MSERLPLFPLGAVLFPGLMLPLRVFEPRYRDLVADLLKLPERERRFGVVAIREGREVGEDGVTALHAVGCTAVVRRVDSLADGTYELVTVGADRFALDGLVRDRSYLVGEVTWLPDELGDASEAAVLAPPVRAALAAYAGALASAGAGEVQLPELPDDPLVLSHLVAATVSLDLDERQALLAEPDGRARLRAELHLLKRETVLLEVLRAVPSPLLTRGPVSPN
ncbi:MAG TPA: LON peptidase substrate-binding domain-containing protein [Mycobacteriales bacterium]|nr:LON peptidase substrate-binding domain-containing protein [Mycobacteriales bacterium]